MKYRFLLSSLLLLAPTSYLFAASIKVPVYSTTESHTEIGWVKFTDTAFGLTIEPSVDLPQGRYGFHIHENPNCADQGKAAGGHLDPHHTQAHKGPFDATGHLGDLPVLVVDAEKPQAILLAPRLTLDHILNHALMIHAHGDNYSDQPKPLGGGGERLYCGVIPGSAP
jgi:Cu-Zn family superoxide dismutase